MSGKIEDSDGEMWTPIVQRSGRSALCAELSREIQKNPSHRLFEKSVCFIGRSDLVDDFLVMLKDGLVGILHLTYKQETDPNWPSFLTKDERLTADFIAKFDPDWDSLHFEVVGLKPATRAT